MIFQEKLFGLVGKNISYSFSQGYFSNKFRDLGLTNCEYQNFDIQTIDGFEKVVLKENHNICGLNVTIPYKQEVMGFLDKIDDEALQIGAVNTIKITKENKLEGYNTDAFGFRKSLEPLLQDHHQRALILGTGGASKAVAFSLEKLGIDFLFVSRDIAQKKNTITYEMIDYKILEEYFLIINTTPVGTFPDIANCVNLPYNLLNEKHLLYDLIYNPEQTQFLKNGYAQGATIKNGLEMLELQAEKSWEIWNS